MKKIVLIAAILFIGSAALLNAQQSIKSTNERQAAQQARIGEGIRSRELTRKETARLEREQRRIRIEKRMAQADGRVTPGEKRFLRHEQNRAGRNIKREKNDAQYR